MRTVRLARHAMATRFELVLQGADAVHLRAAGEEALAEIDRLEARLSFYRPTSAISRINAGAAEAPVTVDARLFALLRQAQHLHAQTGGAFDLTMGPLMRCWGFVGGTGRMPEPDPLAEARSRTGMHHVHLDPARRTVAFDRPGVELDLGAIGKGYAIDEAVALLREAGIERALLHGGTSTVYALGRPAEGGNWTVAVPYPDVTADGGEPEEFVAVVTLEDEALSVSAVAGKAFTAEGRTFGHVLDPETGRPVEGAVLAAVVDPSATAADALSTALLVRGRYLPTDRRALVLFPPDERGLFRAAAHGLPLHHTARLTTPA